MQEPGVKSASMPIVADINTSCSPRCHSFILQIADNQERKDVACVICYTSIVFSHVSRSAILNFEMLPQSFRLGLSVLLGAVYVQAASLKRSSSVFDCLTQNKITYLTSSSANWTAYQAPYNLRLSYTPDVIVVPENDEQVGASVLCAAAAGLKVQAKGGGHSYASYSSGGQDGSLIIEMEKFDEITVDQCESALHQRRCIMY